MKRFITKHFILSLISGLVISSLAHAHEEQAKTLKEKKEKQEKAAFYHSKNVATCTVWKHEAREQINYAGNNVFDLKLTCEIDNETQSLTLTKFKPADSVEYLIIYKYDGPADEGNNTEIIKKSPEDQLLTKTVYNLNEQYFIDEVTTWDAEGYLTSYSSYTYEINQ